jgi:pilus assembly protein CpaE
MNNRFDAEQSQSTVPEASEKTIAPLPRVTVQAFCETSDVAGVIHAVSMDRRMTKAHVKVQMGGANAALEAYSTSPTPNVIVIEATGDRQHLISALDSLSEFCDAGTKVVVIGHVNDVILYRELMRRGVSEYLIAPIDIMSLLRSLSELFAGPEAEPVGRMVAVVGAKGGVGSSAICHNLAWTLSRSYAIQTVIADLDIAYGTAGLDFNQDPPQGIADAVFAPERIDAAFVDRLLSKCSDHLSLMAAPAMLDRTCDFVETALDPVLDYLRSSIPYIFLDVPHVWSGWTRRTLVGAEEIIIVAAPELASLRNAKNLFDSLRIARPNDRQPKILLNMVGMPKRPEISAADFSKALSTEVCAVIPFDAQLFGTASNNGQMIAEVQPTGKVNEIFDDLTSMIMGRNEQKRPKKNILEPFLSKLVRKKA